MQIRLKSGEILSELDFYARHAGFVFCPPLTNEMLEGFDAELMEGEGGTAPEVPRVITVRQGHLYLLTLGLLDDAEAMISQIEDPQERRAAQIEFNSPTWEFESEFLRAMWAKLGGTSDSLHDAFRIAATL